MADVNSNININFNTNAALAQLRQLQAGLSRFHQSLAEGNLAAANAQKGLNAQLIQSIGATGKFSASQVKVAGSTLAFTSALEKNKLSLREYYRYTMAAATANTRVLGKAFAAEREIINRARRDRVKALQAQYVQLNKSNSGFMDAIRIMPKSLAMANGKFTELGTRIQYAAQRQQFLNQLLKQGSTQLLNFGKNTQWAGRQLMVGLTMPLALFGSMAAKTFRELETEIVKFRRVYGDAFTNDSETDVAIDNIRRLATEYTKYGVSVTKTVEMAATAAAAGFTGAALNAQVETATKLAVLGQVEQQQALETTISLQSAFGLSSEELAKKIDFLNAVENQTLLSIEDLTIAIPKAAPVIKQLGGSVEDLAFFMTAMKEGGINASEGANALKSGLASLINPSEKASKFLAQLGINVKSIVEANQGDIKSTVIGFAQALDTLDPLNRARAIEQMFGKFQFARLSTLFQNVTKDGNQASRALGLAGASIEELAILSEREMKKIEDSVGVKFQAAVEQFKQEIMPLGKIFLEALTPVVKFFGNLFEKFNGLSDQTKKVVAVIVGVVAGIGPVLLMTFGLLANGVANVIKFFALLRGGMARLNGQTNILGAGFNYMTQEQIENAASSQQLHQTHTRLVEVFNVEATSVNALASSYNALSTQMRAMASQNPALFAGGLGGARAATSKLPPVRKFRDGILSVPGPKGAGDIQPAMLAPGEAVIPAKTTEKYKGLISAIFNDKVPGFMAGRVPKIVAKTKPVIAHPETQSGATFVGMPKSAAEAAQSRQILDRISSTVKSGRFGSVPPTDFGTLLQPFSGRSFPARGVGGVYRKPNGELVVVKPTIDERTALAEVRATQIAREVHGLVSPKQTIRTMIDPTDPARQRKFIVVESPYDPRIAAMGGKFSKSDMIKQLVASTLRGDKDLAKGNLSGNVLADVGTAGVFDRASGFRDFAKAMPSMEQQAVVNLLGVKGGAKKFFAQETSALAAGMTPQQYDAAIKAEISKSIPRLEKVMKSWDLDPTEKLVYGDMLKRLKAGQKTDWSKLQPIHARAGEGIPKFITGVDPEAPKSVIEQQLAKYNLPEGTQAGSLVDDLKRNAQAELVKSLEKLDPARRAVIETAWKGGKVAVPPSGKERAFNTPRQTAFLNEISSMVPVRVGNEIRYVHKDDYPSFKADPDGRARYARSSQQIIDNMLYRMGATRRGDSFVAGGKFTGRFAGIDHFRTDLRSTGKTAGGGRSTLSSVVRSVADQQKAEFNARVGNPLRTKTGKAMLAAGFTPDQVRYFLRPELSHIVPTESLGIGGRQGDVKMKTGEAQFDTRLVNTFMNAKKRSSNILKWNSNGNPLGLSSQEIQQYQKAADFMSRGLHPATAEQRALIAKAAELDQRVFGFTQRGGKAPASLLPKDIRLSQALSTVLSDKAFRPSQIMNLAATDPNQVLVKPGEFRFDKNARTLTELTTANTGARPAGTTASTGKQSDRRTSTEGPGQTTVTKAQAARIAAAGGVRVIRGRDAGDPDAKLTPYQRQELKKISTKYPGMSESQLRDILRRKLKNEQAILAAKEKEAAAARKAARRAELLPKQMAAAERIENERQSRLLKASENQEKAIKMNEKMDKKAAVKQARQLRQEKIGRFSGGASMALGTAGMGLMMAGNEKGGMAMMGASAVAGLAPMLTNPVAALAAGLIAIAGTVYAFNSAMKKAREEGIALGKSMSMTNAKLVELSKITKTVSASEEADRKRQDRLAGGTEKQRKVGQTILDSEFGKSLLADVETQSKQGMSSVDVGKNIGVQLSSAMLSGVITSEQARSMAMALGNELKDYPLSANIVGEIIQITGPNGENIKKDPLKVALDIDKKSFENSQKMVDFAAKQDFNKSFLGKGGTRGDAAAALRGDKGLVQAGLAAINPAIYQDFFDPKKSGLDKTLSIVSFGLTSSFFQIRDANAQTNKIRTAGAQLMIQELANNQQMIDSLNKQYDIKLKTAKNEEEIAEIEQQRKDALDGLNKQNQEQLNTILASKDAIGDTAWNAAIKGAVDQLYTKGPNKELKNVALTQLEGLENSAFKTQIQLDFASNLIDPMTVIELLNNPDYQTSWNLLVTTTLGGNTAEAGVISQLLSKSGLNVESKKIAIDLLNNKGDDFEPEDITTAIETLSKIQETYGIVLDVNVNSEEKLIRVADAVNLLDGRKFVTKAELQEDKKYAYLIANWDTLVGDGDTISRTLLLNIETMVRDANVLDAYLQAAGTPQEATRVKIARDSGLPELVNDINEKAAAWLADPKNAAIIKALNLGGGGGGGGGGGTKTDPLDFLKPLAMGLKQVSDNAFNALKPVESLLAAFTNKKTQKDAFNLFDGIQNRLLRFGAGQGLRDAVDSMSAEDFSKVAALTGKKALFTFQKGKPRSKDTITGLTTTGKSVDKGYKIKDVADFNLANEEAIKNVQDQTTAYNILISSGLSAGQALEVVADKGQAAAIASGAIKKSDPNWKKYISNIKKSNTDLERQAVLNKAIRENEDFKIYKEMPKLASQMKDLGYSTEQIDAVLGDPQLAKVLMEDLKDGKLDSADIAENLNNIEAKKIIDIQVQLNKGNLKEAAEQGRQIIDELFAAQEGLIRTGAESLEIKTNDVKISDLEAQIDPFLKKIEEITEEVNDLNRDLEMNPLFGDRAIQKIEDENSVLSNDLTIISNAAEEVNKKYDEQAEALSKIQEINEGILDQQRGQLDLADAITSGDISAAARAVQEMRAASAARFASAQSDALQRARESELAGLTARPGGLTREQIEKKQYENSKKIYAMEKDPARLAIISKIQSKQDEIYNTEENSIEPLQTQIDKLVDRNEELQRSIDKQIANIKVLGDTKDAWDKVNAELDYYAAMQAAANNPEALAGALESAGRLKGIWNDIVTKMGEYAKGVPDSVKTSQGFLGAGGNESSTDRAVKDKIAALAAEAAAAAAEAARVAAALRKAKPGQAVATFATGGFVPSVFESGGYAKGTDTVPAMLTPGEYVLRKSAVEKYGVDKLDAMNVGYYKDGGSVLGGISNFWKKVKSNPAGNQLSSIGIGLLQEVGTVLQMAGNKIAPALIPQVSKDQGKSLAEFTQVPGIYRAVTGKSSEGPLGQDSLTAQRILDWSSVAGLFIPGAKAGVTKPITSSVTKSPGLVKKIVTLPKTRKEEAVARQADEARKTAEALEFIKNNPRPVRPGAPGAPPVPDAPAPLSLWDDKIDEILTDFSFWDAPAPKTPLQNIVSSIGSTIAKPVTVPAKFISRVANSIGQAWKYGSDSGARWDGSFDYWGRTMLMREAANRTVGKLADRFNPKITVGKKIDNLDPREPAINALSTLQRYMAPKTGSVKYGLQYRNIPKNILQNFIKNPIIRAKNSLSELRQIASTKGLSSTNAFIRNMAMARQTAGKASHYQIQAIVDSMPGGFEGLLQLLRGVHRTRNPYTAAPLSIYERLAMSKTGEGNTPINAFGPGNYFATSGLISKNQFDHFGEYAYKTALTPSAIFKVLRSRGFATSEDVKKVAEKNDMPFATLEGIAHDADHPLMKALIDEGYLGYRHMDAFTNWMMGIMPGMGFKLVEKPKIADVVSSRLADGTIDLNPTDIPEFVIKRSKGGLIPRHFASGGYAMGTDTVPAMLTPGEFVMSKYAVDTYGVDNMKAINSGSSVGDSVYNYNLNLNVKSDANPDDIARAVMVQIKSVDAQRIRGARF
jgi:TP901 family phage tail tape measure protein